MDDVWSVGGGGGVVVLFFHLGISIKNLMSEEEQWIHLMGKLTDHSLPQVYRVIALLLHCHPNNFSAILWILEF